MNIVPVGDELFHADRRTDMTKQPPFVILGTRLIPYAFIEEKKYI